MGLFEATREGNQVTLRSPGPGEDWLATPPRPLAMMTGGAPARLLLALTSAEGERLLDHALTVRSPDAVTVQRVQPFWDVLELRDAGVPAGATISLEVATAGVARTFELRAVSAVERVEAAPIVTPIVASEFSILCFEAITDERAVQGATWTFAAQGLNARTDTVATPGCVSVYANQAGAASITATANGVSHTLELTVEPRT